MQVLGGIRDNERNYGRSHFHLSAHLGVAQVGPQAQPVLLQLAMRREAQGLGRPIELSRGEVGVGAGRAVKGVHRPCHCIARMLVTKMWSSLRKYAETSPVDWALISWHVF